MKKLRSNDQQKERHNFKCHCGARFATLSALSSHHDLLRKQLTFSHPTELESLKRSFSTQVCSLTEDIVKLEKMVRYLQTPEWIDAAKTVC